MIEPVITLKVRKSDLSIVKSIVNCAIKEYKALMIKEVEPLLGKTDIICSVLIDEKNFLPEWNPNHESDSCLGGFIIFARKNRIVC